MAGLTAADIHCSLMIGDRAYGVDLGARLWWGWVVECECASAFIARVIRWAVKCCRGLSLEQLFEPRLYSHTRGSGAIASSSQ